MANMNIFRVLADVSHVVSIGILIWSIHANRSAEGVSLITQVFYAIVFCSRYLDLFWTFGDNFWNTSFKIVYITSSSYIIFLMLGMYARTREQEKAWKFGAACLVGSLAVAPFAMMASMEKHLWGLWQYSWVFSIILESVCILPQLLLLRQTTVPTVIDSFYLLTLGSYRGLYILNWIYRYLLDPRKPDIVPVIFGIIQTAFYVDFAWVYYSRQRVKLRNGGIVDSDDLSRGWLVGKILGRKGSTDEEEHRGGAGASISADDGVNEGAQRIPQSRNGHSSRDPTRGEETMGMLGADLDDDHEEFFNEDPATDVASDQAPIGTAEEWRR